MRQLFVCSFMCIVMVSTAFSSTAYGITPEQQRIIADKYQQLLIENDALRKQNEELSSLFDNLKRAQDFRFELQEEMFTISEERRQYLIRYVDELKQERDTYVQSYQKVADELNRTALKLEKQRGFLNGILCTFIVGGIATMID